MASNEFAFGTTYTDTFTVEAADGTEQVITVDIAGSNDAATITGDTSATATEDTAPVNLTGTLTRADLDGMDNLFIEQTNIVGDYGQFSITTGGAWTYDETGTHPEFTLGSNNTDTFTVQAADLTTQLITVNIIGA